MSDEEPDYGFYGKVTDLRRLLDTDEFAHKMDDIEVSRAQEEDEK